MSEITTTFNLYHPAGTYLTFNISVDITVTSITFQLPNVNCSDDANLTSLKIATSLGYTVMTIQKAQMVANAAFTSSVPFRMNSGETVSITQYGGSSDNLASCVVTLLADAVAPPEPATGYIVSKPVMMRSDTPISSGSTQYEPIPAWLLFPQTTAYSTDPYRTPPVYNPPEAPSATGSGTKQVAPGFVVPSGGGGGVVALLHLDELVIGEPNSVVDDTGRVWTTVYSDVVVATPTPKYGVGCFMQTGQQHVSTESSIDFAFGTGDFEIEFYIWNDLGSLPYNLFNSWGSMKILWNGSMFRVNHTASGENVYSAEYIPVVEEAWVFLTVNRIDGVIHFYVDGVSYGGDISVHDFQQPDEQGVKFPHYAFY